MADIKTILCIEDDLFIGEMYARSFAKMATSRFNC